MLVFKARWLVFAFSAMGAACSYAPHPGEGKQECYKGLCSDGYVCAHDNRCYSAGKAPVTPGTGGVGTGGVMGGIGGSGAGGTIVIGSDAGIPGAGGTSTCQPRSATGNSPLIDNMADGDGAIILQDGRSGGWYTYNDNTGTQTPAAPQVAAGQGQICTSGFGFIDWGAGLGVSLDADATKSCDYDGSIYKGISFWIEGVAVGGEVRFTVQTSNIASSNAGGTCVASGTTNDCDDTYGANLVSTTAGISCTTAVLIKGENNSWVEGTGIK